MLQVPSIAPAVELVRKNLSGKDADELVRFLEEQERWIKRQSLEFTTTLEIANQINSKGLDIKNIESYVLTTVRGQFGVVKVLFLRQSEVGGEEITVHDGREERHPLAFSVDGALGKALARHGKPFLISRAEGALAEIPELAEWKKMTFEVAVPLIRGEGELKGLLLLGKKFTRDDYNDRDMNFLGLMGTMIAISLHNAQLYMRSIMDSLTMIFTRGHFDIQLAQEIDRLKRYGARVGAAKRCVSLIMMDVDYFKKFNDRYGHQVGDRVLVHLATLLRQDVRSMDVVARYGGEEFVLICPETNKDECALLAERLRRKVASAPVETDEYGRLPVSVSVGVATYPDDCASGRDLIRQADMALYRAKELGRNRTVLAPDGRELKPDEMRT